MDRFNLKSSRLHLGSYLLFSVCLCSLLSAQKTSTQQEPSFDQLVYTGMMSFGGKKSFSVYDPQSKQGFWIPIDGSREGISVLNYDEESGTLTLSSSGGQSRQLGLNTGSVVTLRGAGVSTAISPKPPARQKDPETLKKEENARKMVMNILENSAKARERQRAEREARLQAIRARQAAERRAQGR